MTKHNSYAIAISLIALSFAGCKFKNSGGSGLADIKDVPYDGYVMAGKFVEVDRNNRPINNKPITITQYPWRNQFNEAPTAREFVNWASETARRDAIELKVDGKRWDSAQSIDGNSRMYNQDYMPNQQQERTVRLRPLFVGGYDSQIGDIATMKNPDGISANHSPESDKTAFAFAAPDYSSGLKQTGQGVFVEDQLIRSRIGKKSHSENYQVSDKDVVGASDRGMRVYDPVQTEDAADRLAKMVNMWNNRRPQDDKYLERKEASDGQSHANSTQVLDSQDNQNVITEPDAFTTQPSYVDKTE